MLSDEEWDNFALWQDKNMDGFVDEDEFTKITDSEIKQLNLDTDESQESTYPIEEYATYTKNDGEESYLDITITEDKLSEEDKLILKEAIKLNEELAYSYSTSEIDEVVIESNLIDEEEYYEENIA